MENLNKMSFLASSSIRAVVSEANNRGISKDDIVALIPKDGQIFLVYYTK